jgi:hypothetical protein
MSSDSPESARADVFLLWVDNSPVLLKEEPQVNPAGVLRGVEPDGNTVWYSDWERCYRPTLPKLKAVYQDIPHRQKQLIDNSDNDTQVNFE